MFHPIIVYGILCDTCKKVFSDPDVTGLDPLIEPKLSDFDLRRLTGQGWRVVGDVTLCPKHVNDVAPPKPTPADARLREDNRRLRAENERLWSQLAQHVKKEN